MLVLALEALRVFAYSPPGRLVQANKGRFLPTPQQLWVTWRQEGLSLTVFGYPLCALGDPVLALHVVVASRCVSPVNPAVSQSSQASRT